MNRRRFSYCGGVLCLLFLVATAGAQQFTGTLQGVVRDASGAVVPGAEVSVTNAGTNQSRILITDASGAYVAPLLKTGTYRVSVRLTGFKTSTIDEVKITVQKTRS